MKTFKYILWAASVGISLNSCELLLPDDIINPNVTDDTFLNSANAMQAWVNGANRSFAEAMGNYCELMEILSDNYFNNYSRSSQVFDIPRILYTDTDVTGLQRHIGKLREAADYGIGTVAEADASTTRSDLFNLYYIKAFSFILGGEYFRGLPDTEGGEIKTWNEYLHTALDILDSTLAYVDTDEEKAFVHTLKARTHYRLGDKESASSEARTALELSSDFVKQVEFDGTNGVNNPIQEAVWDTWFQPLPRLDFLDPKYFQLSATEQRPINLAKAEENYLILAEASLADNNEAQAKTYMQQLLILVKSRPVQLDINDQLEERFNGGYKHFPERAFGKTVMDGKMLAAVLVLAGGHPFDADKQVVEPARARQADFASRVEKRGMRLLQDAFGILHVQVLQEMLGRRPCPFLEGTLEMPGAHVDVLRHLLQTGLFVPVLPDETDGGGDALVV